MKTKVRTLFAVILFSCTSAVVTAQGLPGDPGGDPGGTNVPIDGGLSLLIAAGIGIAAKKGYDKRKKDNADPAQDKMDV